MTEPDAVFIEYSDVASLTGLSEGARVGNVRYRKRPPDKGCLHAQVQFRKVGHGLVDVECVEEGCDHAWRQVKVMVMP